MEFKKTTRMGDYMDKDKSSSRHQKNINEDEKEEQLEKYYEKNTGLARK